MTFPFSRGLSGFLEVLARSSMWRGNIFHCCQGCWQRGPIRHSSQHPSSRAGDRVGAKSRPGWMSLGKLGTPVQSHEALEQASITGGRWLSAQVQVPREPASSRRPILCHPGDKLRLTPKCPSPSLRHKRQLTISPNPPSTSLPHKQPSIYHSSPAQEKKHADRATLWPKLVFLSTTTSRQMVSQEVHNKLGTCQWVGSL